MRCGWSTLILNERVRLSIASGLQRGESGFDGGEALAEPLDALAVGGPQLADRVGEPCRRRFAAPGDLLARALAAADDVVEQALGAIAGPGRRFRSRGQRLLDGAAQRLPDRLGTGTGRISRRLRSSPKLRVSAALPGAAVGPSRRARSLSSPDRAVLPAPERADRSRRPRLRRSRPSARDRPACAGPAADEQSQPWPLGLPRRDAGGPRADRPGDRDRRAERGRRPHRGGRAGRPPGDPDRHLRGDRRRSGARIAGRRRQRPRPPTASATPSAAPRRPTRT